MYNFGYTFNGYLYEKAFDRLCDFRWIVILPNDKHVSANNEGKPDFITIKNIPELLNMLDPKTVETPLNNGKVAVFKNGKVSIGDFTFMTSEMEALIKGYNEYIS